MPRIYKFEEDTGFESGYESDSGTEYFPAQDLGMGSFARAREFTSALPGNNKKSKVVLSPVDPDDVSYAEVNRKYSFFSTLYSEQSVQLIKKNDTYRLILPLIPGEEYKKLDLSAPTSAQCIWLFILAIEALQECHSKGFVVIDLKENNILYHSSEEKSYLIDGGLATKHDAKIPSLFVCDDNARVHLSRNKYKHIAPECWSTRREKADYPMDIYSLGSMMERLIKKPSDRLRSLINQCKSIEPNARPSLTDLKHVLYELMRVNNYESSLSRGVILDQVILNIKKTMPIVKGINDQEILTVVAAHHLFSMAEQGKQAQIPMPAGVRILVHGDILLLVENDKCYELWRLDKLKSLQYLRDEASLKVKAEQDYYKSQETLSSLYKTEFSSRYRMAYPINSYLAIRTFVESVVIDPYWDNGVLKKELVDVLKVIKSLAIDLSAGELTFLQENKKLQLAILDFIELCNTMKFGASLVKEEILRYFKKQAIHFAIQGLKVFKEKYPLLRENMVILMSDTTFNRIVTVLGNILIVALMTIASPILSDKLGFNKKVDGFFSKPGNSLPDDLLPEPTLPRQDFLHASKIGYSKY